MATTALGIRCPWSGDENDPPDWRYEAWFWLYHHSRVLRHKVGLHDWRKIGVPVFRRCTWCGKHAA